MYLGNCSMGGGCKLPRNFETPNFTPHKIEKNAIDYSHSIKPKKPLIYTSKKAWTSLTKLPEMFWGLKAKNKS